MTDQPVKVSVTGLRDLQAALKTLEASAPAELKDVLKGIAADVAKDAGNRVPHRTGAAERSYKPRGTLRGASIAFGGLRAVYAPWLDFGGSTKVDPAKSDRVFRPRVDGGRYLYPAITENLQDAQERTANAINDVVRRYGMAVTDA